MKQKLFVLSMDAMVREDVAQLLQKPNFRRIMEKRAEAERVLSVYPASTYPAHTTLMTGCYPGSHGVYTNVPLQTVSDGIAHWPLSCDRVYREDLFAAAKRAGCSTAAVYWPITACNPNVDHEINEYFFYYPGEGDRVEETFAAQGADEVALEAVRKYKHLLPVKMEGKEPAEKEYDNFLMACACHLIRKVQPDLLMVHNCCLDSRRHSRGVFGENLPAAYEETDAWLGEVIAAMEEAGVYEDTNFVILSDHGQRDYHLNVRFNALLVKEGLIRLAPDNSIYDWQAYAQTNGMSTTVYLTDPTNEILSERVYAALKRLQAEGKYGIERIWTKEELAARYGQKGPYSFFVEAEEGVNFSNSLQGDFVSETKRVYGSHGYQPEKGAQPVFLGHGPAFREGAVIPEAKLVDVAPTLAAILGQSLPEADGRVLKELLKEEK